MTVDPALARLRERILAADADRTPLRIRGGGSKDFYGNTPQGELLETGGYRGIVDYEPTELVITARCGTPLAELEAALAERGQWLPFEPPAFAAQDSGATIGGVVAAGLSGPGRQSAGAVRDYVLGAAMIDARGNALHFGGQVMKNVAGYDVSRLLCGSLGMLGVIAEVSLKVMPRPAASATVAIRIGAKDALRCLNEWGGRPLPISASAWHDDVLRLRLSGARAAVESATSGFAHDHGAVRLDDAEAAAYWSALRHQTLPFFVLPDEPVPPRPGTADAPRATALWRLSVPSTAAPLSLPGEQLIEWGGAQRWWRTDAEESLVRQAAARVGGHATLFRGGDRSAGVFTPLKPAALELHRRLKAAFDPNGIFNPGRLVAGL
ncbi:MAG: glycolate oxidase subunit GlcE [Limnobacter sp.]|mgnify:FL=1|nr:glycolate oxidase subunit GlcE [Limnobacter sp.]